MPRADGAYRFVQDLRVSSNFVVLIAPCVPDVTSLIVSIPHSARVFLSLIKVFLSPPCWRGDNCLLICPFWKRLSIPGSFALRLLCSPSLMASQTLLVLLNCLCIKSPKVSQSRVQLCLLPVEYLGFTLTPRECKVSSARVTAVVGVARPLNKRHAVLFRFDWLLLLITDCSQFLKTYSDKTFWQKPWAWWLGMMRK